MKCIICKVSAHDKPLLRTNKKGIDGIMMCEKCFKKEEPELYNNTIEDLGSFFEDLKEITGNHRK